MLAILSFMAFDSHREIGRFLTAVLSVRYAFISTAVDYSGN